MGQCNCENREHIFLLTTTKSVWTLPPAISDFDRKPNSCMEVFDGERSSYGHQISPITMLFYQHGHHLWDLKLGVFVDKLEEELRTSDTTITVLMY